MGLSDVAEFETRLSDEYSALEVSVLPLYCCMMGPYCRAPA